MDKQRVLKRINNLKKVKAIVEIAKFDTLQNLAKATQVSNHHYAASEITKEAIAHANKRFAKGKKVKKPKKLFIYITIPSKLIKVSYEKLNSTLLSQFDKATDEIIAVGSPAIDLSKKQKLKVYKSFAELDESQDQVISLLNNIITTNEFNEIKLIANTPQIKKQSYKIYPIETGDKKNKLSKKRFYHSLSDIFVNVANTYVENIVKGIYQETYKIFYKEKLLRHEGSIKNVDERIQDLKLQMVKLNRKEETDDMILVTQNARRGK